MTNKPRDARVAKAFAKAEERNTNVLLRKALEEASRALMKLDPLAEQHDPVIIDTALAKLREVART